MAGFEGVQGDSREGQQIADRAALPVGIDRHAQRPGFLRRIGGPAHQRRRFIQKGRLGFERRPPFRGNQSGGHGDRRQALVGVVGPQRQSVLGPAGEHPVGLGHPACDQIVDHHADIGLVPAEDDRVRSGGGAGGVQPGEETLGPRLLIARGAVDLAGQIQSAPFLDLQRRRQLARVDVVVFDGVAEAEHLDGFKARDGAQEGGLGRVGHRGRDAVRIDGRIIEAFRLEEDLVRGLVGEAHDLVLDRGAVAGPAAGQVAAVDGAVAEVVGDDAVGRLGRVGHAAGDLRHVDAVGQEAERHRFVVGRLHLQPVPGDGAPVQPRRRARLEPAHGQAGAIEIGGQSGRRGFSVTAGGDALVALVDDAVEEGAGRQHDRAGPQFGPLPRRHPDDTVPLQDQALGRSGHQGQVRGRGQFGLHGLAVQATVDLAARTLHRRTLGAVEQAELDAGDIAQPAHQAIHGVDLAHQMTLAQTADGGVTGHLADGLELLGQQQGGRPGARGRGRGLTAGVASPDDDDVETLHGRGHRGKPALSLPGRGRCFT